MRNRWWVAPGVAAAAALLAACGSSSSSGSGSAASSGGSSSAATAAPVKASTSAVGLKSETAGGNKVLTTAQGFTVYEFGIDTPTMSKCNATCLKFWPALTGMPSGAGLKGTFGTIKGTGGITQATYDGHPLYIFVDDKKPGVITGNGVNLDGGVWHALTPSGTKLPKAKTVSSSSGGGSTGGYGY